MASISPLLGLGLATAGIPAAITAGQKAGRDQYDQRTQAMQRKKQGDLQLQSMQHTVDQQPLQDQQLQQQLEIQGMELKKLKSDSLKKDTFGAMDRFFESGDPRSLNQFFKANIDNPQVQSMFNGTIKVEPINTVNSEDQKLLLGAGLSQEDLDAADGKKDGKIDWVKLKNRFVKVTNSRGETKLTDMVHLAAISGYGDYADQKNLAKLKSLADVTKAQNSGLTANQKDANALAKASGTNPGDELRRLTTPKATHDPNDTLPSLVKEANAIAASRDRLDVGTGTRADQVLSNLGKEKLGGVTAGKQVIAEQARTTLKSLKFDSMSYGEMQKNPDVRNAINRLEEAHPISAAHQKALVELSAIVALADPASRLDAAQTGLLDSMTSGLKQYISNDTTTNDNKHTYEALMGTFRHALMGAAMTDSELKLFTDAYAIKSQKLGPVLSGLKAALVQVKAKLEAIGGFNDPSVMKFRTHGIISDISGSLRHVNQRLSFLNKVSAGLAPKEAAIQVAKAFAPKKSVDIDKALGF